MSKDQKSLEAKKLEAARVAESSSKTNDKCITDFLMKGASGLIIGTVFTVFFTRPRTYPIWLGLGVGMGLAYDCCQKRLATVDDNQR
ncbi:GL11664 [Drosophila persimilis]|uniref:MICOS complex subunit MIC10 n=2 Tax=pseudoobscura subgroup TaxID=32358 RepID=A0A6I8UTZ8_DROPS|nr:MICOS complex subunit Mic10 [Drosophila pseudoobscura]XP_002016587.1 MICOS complex subunit Mic10 [Drosophila persimilis]XP_015039807.1 MICOS complex subunit Mic10 [Drosophila pseudoobscura]XP_026842290.1 MICOS complex subunit Mic10 [Drosophila persimilis]EDW32477.1 GL11664 [Drosophila persimilis]